MRRIAHIDMDAFYAAIEVRDNPELEGKPVIIGGERYARNVVSTCSYEAREFGVHSAMATDRAYKLCPDGVFLNGNMNKYREASRQILEILRGYTWKIEPLSLDEAYLDISDLEMDSVDFADELRGKILDRIGITCSIGVAPNKFLAKVASEFNKPNGVKIITVEDQGKVLEELNIRSFSGVGRKTMEKMDKLGIKNGADLKRRDVSFLVSNFGKLGSFLYDLVRGVDERVVVVERLRQSISKERTLKVDIELASEVARILYELAGEVEEVLKDNSYVAANITLKVKYANFKVVSRSLSTENEFQSSKEMWYLLKYLFNEYNLLTSKIRLLGVGVSNFKNEDELRQVYLDLDLVD